VHLVNTFFLLASLTLTAHWVSGGRPTYAAEHPAVALGALAGALGLLLVGVSGAVAALGDTLFPAQTLGEALAADLSSTSHLLIRLRVLHPALAVAVGLALAATAWRLPLDPGDRRGRLAARAVVLVTLAQLAAGFVNVLLLAPVAMQLLHLLLADLLWMAYVVLAASSLGARPSRAAAAVTARTVRAG
jgi:heme A synthase